RCPAAGGRVMLSATELEVLGTSFHVAALALLWSLPLAIACAFLLSRRFPGRFTLDGLVHLPVILPPVLTGFLLLLLFGRNGPVGHWLEQVAGIRLVFTRQGAALATAVMVFPILVRASRIAFESMDSRLLEAAAMLRAGRLEAKFRAPASGITVLFGPSGSGKSSLLSAIAGFVPCEGYARLGRDLLCDSAVDLDVPPHRRGMGMVFQDARLFPHLTAR